MIDSIVAAEMNQRLGQWMRLLGEMPPVLQQFRNSGNM